MSRSSAQRNILNELEHTEVVLQELLTTLFNLSSALKPIEREMRVSDFTSSGEIVEGMSKGVVCVLTGLIKGDPLEKILTLRGRGREIPILIKAGDRTETKVTVENIVGMLQVMNQKRSLEYIVNLRWAELPAPLEHDNVVVLGDRYVSGNFERLMKLESNLNELLFRVIKDKGEFGGGLLVYEVIRSFSNRKDMVVTELTLSRQVVENDVLVIKILNMLASF
jgi:hypothetical protein